MAKRFTPGPWKVVEVSGTLPYVVAPDTDEVVAERVFNGNQHLIAAAPDLLAACKAVLQTVEQYMERYGDNGGRLATARGYAMDALVKADPEGGR
jgi:hypothetical protein